MQESTLITINATCYCFALPLSGGCQWSHDRCVHCLGYRWHGGLLFFPDGTGSLPGFRLLKRLLHLEFWVIELLTNFNVRFRFGGPYVQRILCPVKVTSFQSSEPTWKSFRSLVKTRCSISFPPVPKRSSTKRLMIPATDFPVAGLPAMGSSVFHMQRPFLIARSIQVRASPVPCCCAMVCCPQCSQALSRGCVEYST